MGNKWLHNNKQYVSIRYYLAQPSNL